MVYTLRFIVHLGASRGYRNRGGQEQGMQEQRGAGAGVGRSMGFRSRGCRSRGGQKLGLQEQWWAGVGGVKGL